MPQEPQLGSHEPNSSDKFIFGEESSIEGLLSKLGEPPEVTRNFSMDETRCKTREELALALGLVGSMVGFKA